MEADIFEVPLFHDPTYGPLNLLFDPLCRAICLKNVLQSTSDSDALKGLSQKIVTTVDTLTTMFHVLAIAKAANGNRYRDFGMDIDFQVVGDTVFAAVHSADPVRYTWGIRSGMGRGLKRITPAWKQNVEDVGRQHVWEKCLSSCDGLQRQGAVIYKCAKVLRLQGLEIIVLDEHHALTNPPGGSCKSAVPTGRRVSSYVHPCAIHLNTVFLPSQAHHVIIEPASEWEDLQWSHISTQVLPRLWFSQTSSAALVLHSKTNTAPARRRRTKEKVLVYPPPRQHDAEPRASTVTAARQQVAPDPATPQHSSLGQAPSPFGSTSTARSVNSIHHSADGSPYGHGASQMGLAQPTSRAFSSPGICPPPLQYGSHQTPGAMQATGTPVHPPWRPSPLDSNSNNSFCGSVPPENTISAVGNFKKRFVSMNDLPASELTQEALPVEQRRILHPSTPTKAPLRSSSGAPQKYSAVHSMMGAHSNDKRVSSLPDMMSTPTSYTDDHERLEISPGQHSPGPNHPFSSPDLSRVSNFQVSPLALHPPSSKKRDQATIDLTGEDGDSDSIPTKKAKKSSLVKNSSAIRCQADLLREIEQSPDRMGGDDPIHRWETENQHLLSLFVQMMGGMRATVISAGHTETRRYTLRLSQVQEGSTVTERTVSFTDITDIQLQLTAPLVSDETAALISPATIETAEGSEVSVIPGSNIAGQSANGAEDSEMLAD